MKPHEIARLKRESKQNGGNSSDIDLSDFDMDNVDDLLAMTETNTSTENTTSNHELPPNGKSSRHKNTDMLETNNNKNKSKSSSSSSKKKSQIVLEPDDFVLDVGMDSESPKKLRFNSTSSDKIWSTKTSNEETYKSLLSNLETTLQSIDTLVVGPSSSSTMEMSSSSSSGKRKSKMMESTTQRTQPVHIVRVDKESVQAGSTNNTSVGRKSKANKGGNNKQSAKGPQMIRTEKCTVSSMEGGKKKSKSVVTRTQTTTIDVMPKSVGIVDDYDIISPALQPPKQISCSPLHIKQEHDSQHVMMKSQNHQQHAAMSSSSVAHNRTQSSSNPRHINDVYDAHLLLEASGLRNALDEILRSPLKSDKLGGSRQRFTSESSTQFLAEQSEEEQHLIKIEPTSPDLREIVNGVSSVTASEVVSSAGMELNVRTSQPRRSNKASRSQRSSNSNRKYFEFSSEPHHLSETKAASSSSSSASDKRLSSSNQMSIVSSTTKSSKSARTEAAKSTKSSSSSVVQNPTSFLDYAIVDSFNAVTSSSPTHHNASSFASISAVVSAADATAAAAQQNPSPNRKPQRYFECEMCSAVFSDRAQLLDHVPIHI